MYGLQPTDPVRIFLSKMIRDFFERTMLRSGRETIAPNEIGLMLSEF
jgi:hypothetical protein